MKKFSLYIFLLLIFCTSSKALPKCEGNDYKQWTNCSGSYTNDAGRKYTGEFGDIPGIRHGQGISILKGTKFEGKFKNDKAVEGKLTYANGNIYIGTFNELGNFQGKGTFIFTDGSKFVGHFKNHLMDGQGTMTKSNGEVLKGIWREGKLAEIISTN